MKLFQNFLFILISTCFFCACKKTPATPALEGAGQTIVKFVFSDDALNPEGIPDTSNGKFAGYKLFNIDLVSTPQKLIVADLRRDVTKNEDLQKPMTVIIRNDPGAVNAYDPDMSPLPISSFVPDDGNPLSGNDYTVTFQPGEFAKEIKITLPDVLNSLTLGTRYGIGFTIATVSQDGHISALQKTMVAEIGLKNIYDGIYRLKGYIYRNVPPVDATSTGVVGPKEIALETTGVNSVQFINSHGWANTATIGLAASVAYPTYTVNQTDNTVTIISDGGPFPDGLKNEPSLGVSRYDPVTKTFYTYATWSGGVASRYMSDTLVYLRRR